MSHDDDVRACMTSSDPRSIASKMSAFARVCASIRSRFAFPSLVHLVPSRLDEITRLLRTGRLLVHTGNHLGSKHSHHLPLLQPDHTISTNSLTHTRQFERHPISQHFEWTRFTRITVILHPTLSQLPDTKTYRHISTVFSLETLAPEYLETRHRSS